ncbi:MAG: hypothetical protein ABSH29_23460 [Acidimicrobiales bacterium]
MMSEPAANFQFKGPIGLLVSFTTCEDSSAKRPGPTSTAPTGVLHHLRGQLCEAAWAYQHSPNIGVGIRERQQGVPPETLARSWAAQVRLSKRFRQLAAHKNVRSVVAAAIARELAGFLWAEIVAEA